MNFVGKILTVSILVLSLAYLMISLTLFQTHRNWRVRAEENKKKAEELTRINLELQNELQGAKDRLQVEATGRKFALAALHSKAVQTEVQLASRNREYETLLARAGTQATQIEANSRTLADAVAQNLQLRTQLRDAQQNRDQSFGEVVRLTDLLHQAQGNIATMVERQQQLLASNARMKYVMERRGLDEFVSIEGPPRVDGYVTQVGARDLLEVSIGEDDGLKRGHTLDVIRNNSYLARVIVREAWPDRAVVQIIPEFRKGSIKKGDRVASKLD